MVYLTSRELAVSAENLRFAPEMTIKSRELRAKYCAEVLNFQQENI